MLWKGNNEIFSEMELLINKNKSHALPVGKRVSLVLVGIGSWLSHPISFDCTVTGQCIYIYIYCIDMDVSENSGTPKSSILIGFSTINHPFWGTPIFGNTHICVYLCIYSCSIYTLLFSLGSYI